MRIHRQKKTVALLLSAVLFAQSADMSSLYVQAAELPAGGSYAEFAVSDNSVSENSVSESGISENYISKSDISGSDISGSDISENTISEQEYVFVPGYVLEPNWVPAPASALGIDLKQTETLRILEDDAERDRVFADGGTEVESAWPYGYSDTVNLKTYLEKNLPAVRNQNPYGTCWAHATTGAAELDMINRYNISKDADYSEMHLIYWTMHQGTNPVMGDTGDRVTEAANNGYMMRGGNSDMTSQTLLKRRGIAAESTLPYSQENTSKANAGTLVADPADEFKDEAHLQNRICINITKNSSLVKQAIKEHGSVQVSYDDDSDFYSSEYNSYYNNVTSSVNHGVLIVGWDDNFPKENFVQTAPGDGAWLIRNSWGYSSSKTLSHEKYFWMSYYDKGLQVTGEADVFEMSPVDDGYDNLYYYDSQLSASWQYTGSVKAANIYTVGGTRQDSCNVELLKAVTFSAAEADNAYTLEIYTGLKDPSDPTSGKKAASQKGILAFKGDYTIELSEPITLKKGEVFSVVVNAKGLRFEGDYGDYSVAKANKGESFIYFGSAWSDMADMENGNFRITALTEDLDSMIADDFTFEENVIFAYEEAPACVKPVAPERYTGILSYQFAPVSESGEVGVYTSEIPSESGLYQVRVSGTETEDCKAFTNVTSNKWRFRIEEPYVVSMPAADIASGKTVQNKAKLQLFCATPDAVIYYTLDGSEPSTNKGIKYAGFITLSGTPGSAITLKAIAVKNAHSSEVLTCSYDIAVENFGDITEEDRAYLAKKGITTAEKIPDKIWIGQLPEKEYTGKAIKLDSEEIRVYDHTKLLTDKDYKITYSANTNAGEATIKVSGIGNYKDSIEGKFTIHPIDLSGESISTADIYLKETGKELTPKPVVKWNGKVLKENKDYALVYPESGIKDSSDKFYTIIISGTVNVNFVGQTSCKVKIYSNDKIDLNKCSVTKIPAQAFQKGGYKKISELLDAKGNALEFAVKNGKQSLVQDTDYTFAFEDADRSGTATLVLTAKDGSAYAGSKRISFKINGRDVKSAFVLGAIEDRVYTGRPQTLGSDFKIYDVLDPKTPLKEGVDYTLTYSSNVKAGKASVTITGSEKAGYSGKVTKTFTIKKYDLKYTSAKDDTCQVYYDQKVVYEKGKTCPKVTIKLTDGTLLTENTDYTVKYANNSTVATADADKKAPTITITGKGNYATASGGIKLNYTIEKKSISADAENGILSATAADKAYKKSANIYKSVPVLIDTNGNKLAAGTDYDKNTMKYRYDARTVVEYKKGKTSETKERYAGEEVDKNDIIPAGTVIRIELEGKNNYEGTRTIRYRIVASDLSKAKVTVKTQTYTGNVVMPEGNAKDPAQGDVVVTVGNDVLVYGVDYKITGYTNNISQGKNKAALTVQGIGNYGGSKTAKFTILQKTFLSDIVSALYKRFMK